MEKKSETAIEKIVYNNNTYKDEIYIASALDEFFIVKVGGQSEFDPTRHMNQAVATQQTFAFSQMNSKSVILLLNVEV